MSAEEHDVNGAHQMGNLMNTPPGKKPYIKKHDRQRIANLLSDTHKLLVELGKMNLRDATEEFRQMRTKLEERLEKELSMEYPTEEDIDEI